MIQDLEGRPLTGKIRARCGFSFLEIMITAMILGSGMGGLYKAFLTCLNYQNYLSTRLYAMQFLNDKVAGFQAACGESGPPVLNAEPYPVKINNQIVTFLLDADYQNIDNLQNLLQMDLTLSWQQSGHSYAMRRSLYLHCPRGVQR